MSRLYVFQLAAQPKHTGLYLEYTEDGVKTALRVDHGYSSAAFQRKCSVVASSASTGFPATSGDDGAERIDVGDAAYTLLDTPELRATFENLLQCPMVLAASLPDKEGLMEAIHSLRHKQYDLITFNCRHYCKAVLLRLKKTGVHIASDATKMLDEVKAADLAAAAGVGFLAVGGVMLLWGQPPKSKAKKHGSLA
eukprot:m.152585 g.152585  ORF g.152585 m.152585 type:complete len:195 (-) comp16362_c1_seq1:2400-2984(-)